VSDLGHFPDCPLLGHLNGLYPEIDQIGSAPTASPLASSDFCLISSFVMQSGCEFNQLSELLSVLIQEQRLKCGLDPSPSCEKVSLI
jgi:hypothetical protein